MSVRPPKCLAGCHEASRLQWRFVSRQRELYRIRRSLRVVPEGHPKQRANAPGDRRGHECARRPALELPALVQRGAKSRPARHPAQPQDGRSVLRLAPLGAYPNWCNDPKGGRKPINAKAETVSTLPTFREAYARRRCILPVDGFFEWKAAKGERAKQPFASAMQHGSPFGIAGLWENWKDQMLAPAPRKRIGRLDAERSASPVRIRHFFAPARRRPRAFHATPQSSRRGAVRGGPDFHLAQAQRRDAASALRAMSRAGC
jgi:SOS response associated peptidase (SRAP)